MPTANDLRTQLEKGSDEARVVAMKKLLVAMLNGDAMPQLLMTVIRYILPSKNKVLKRLLTLYWELIPKCTADGRLRQEMILVW